MHIQRAMVTARLFYKKDQSLRIGLIIFYDINCLIVMPTHDIYLDNGTDIGLTVDTVMIAYAGSDVNIPTTYFGNSMQLILGIQK